MCMTSTTSVVGGNVDRDVIGRRVGPGRRVGCGHACVVTRGRSLLGTGAEPEPGHGDATGVS